MTESQLAEQIHQLADHILAPPPVAEHDIVRGRARLRRRRTTLAGGVLALAAIAGVVASVVQPDGAPVTDPAPPVASGPGSDDLSQRVRDLAQQPGSREWERLSIPADAIEGALGVLRQHADPSMGRIVALGADRTWAQLVPVTCPAAWTCAPVDVPGARQAMLARADGVAQVAAEFPEGSVVLTIAASASAVPADLAYGGTDAERIKWDDGRP